MLKESKKKADLDKVGSAFIIRAACYRQEFRPSVVAMADRILITVWMIIFQVSLFLIIIIGLRTPSKSPPLWGDFLEGAVFVCFTLAVNFWLLVL